MEALLRLSVLQLPVLVSLACFPFTRRKHRAISQPPGPLTNANVNGRIVIASLALLCVVVLLMLGLHIYAKCFWRRAQLRQVVLWRQHLHFPVMQQAIAAGLDEAAIASLPTFVFKLSQKGALECAVCLSEMQEDDEGKILPKCSHSFHAKCIDMWLLAHATCPLCRTSADAAADSGPSSAANADELEMTVSFRSSNAEDGDAEALPSPGWRWRRSISDRFSQSMRSGVEFPTNVLFWGNHSHVSSRTNPAQAPTPHMALDIPRPTQALMAARSSSSGAGDACSSWHAERQGKVAAAGLSVFRRLLSGERKIFPAEQETGSSGESVTEMLQK